MHPLVHRVARLTAGLLLWAGMSAHAADPTIAAFPDKPVRIIVPYGAGGAADILARILADKLGQQWSQAVIVDNKPGGVGAIGISLAIKAPPDGYTLVSVPVSDLAVNPHLYRKRAFNVLTDLEPISQVGAVPNVLVVSSALDVRDVKGLLAAGKARPDGLSYSSPGLGSQAHLAAEMFARKVGFPMLHVPYNSVSAALLDVAGGKVDMMIAQLPAVLPFLKGGRIHAVAMVADRRSELAPDIPTLPEGAGFSLGDAVSWSGLMAPAGTPLALREKIAAAVTAAMRSPQVREKLAQQGTIGIGGSPDALRRAIQVDYERYGQVIREMKLQLD